MGYIFECDDNVVWSPSNIWAKVFLFQAKGLSQFLGVNDGFFEDEAMADMVEVDKVQLKLFLNAISAFLIKVYNNDVKQLLRSLIVHLLAIYISCGEDAGQLSWFEEDWLRDAVKLARTGFPR